MRTFAPSTRRLRLGLLISTVAPVVTAAALLPARTHVDGAVFGLVMLLPTAIAAAVGGPLPATVAVVVGSVTHNLAFTEPYWTLRVADATDVVGLAAHIVVAIAVSVVVVREQRAAQLAAAREEQVARVRLLEELDRTRTALLGAVSHDLRTPLAAIAAAASELRATDVRFSESERAELAGTIVEQAARLDHTVANLLAAGRLQSDAVRVEREAVEVEDLLTEVLTELEPLGARHRVDVQVAPSTPLAHVDPVLVTAAVRNLVENALRHTPATGRVHIEAHGTDGWVVLRVVDQGAGLGGADPARLFESFHSTDRDGIGLGLAICRGFVEAHGGRVRAYDESGGGATFEVTLPGLEEPAP